jgi:hypothetical protein
MDITAATVQCVFTRRMLQNKWQFTRRIYEAKKVGGLVNAKCLVQKGIGENYTIQYLQFAQF